MLVVWVANSGRVSISFKGEFVEKNAADEDVGKSSYTDAISTDEIKFTYCTEFLINNLKGVKMQD